MEDFLMIENTCPDEVRQLHHDAWVAALLSKWRGDLALGVCCRGFLGRFHVPRTALVLYSPSLVTQKGVGAVRGRGVADW